MCNVCGCGQGGTRIEDQDVHRHAHQHNDNKDPCGHRHHHGDEGLHHYGHGPAHAHAPGLSQSRMVQIEQDILAKNNDYARANRAWLAEREILALNLVSSPGSGKTTLLARTVAEIAADTPSAVIEGDQQTSNDAERIRATGVPAIQINTGKGCHLDAHMIGHALQTLPPPAGGVLFIENVGNLVCPAAFDLGEAHKVAILAVTEGEDKPLKYPDMFHASDLLLLNKVDLLPYLDFDVARCLEYARRINPEIEILQVSATNGRGLGQWYQWIRERCARRHPVAAGHSTRSAVDRVAR